MMTLLPKGKQDLPLNLVVHQTAACLQFPLHEVTRGISSQSAGCMLFADTHLYTCVKSCTVGVECLTQKHSAPCWGLHKFVLNQILELEAPWLEPKPLDVESSTLFIRLMNK